MAVDGVGAVGLSVSLAAAADSGRGADGAAGSGDKITADLTAATSIGNAGSGTSNGNANDGKGDDGKRKWNRR